MKLYTEEQLLNTVKSIRHYDEVYDEKVANERIEKHLKALQPIELPSEQEIEQEASKYNLRAAYLGFQVGALYVINKIKEGNK